MKTIFGYIRAYYRHLDRKIFITITAFTALLIFINYYADLDTHIRSNPSFGFNLAAWYGIFLLAFGTPWLVQQALGRRNYFHERRFTILLFVAPAIFSLKLCFRAEFTFSADESLNAYWNHIIYWPLLLLIIGSLLWVVWRLSDRDQPFYGTGTRGLRWKPYFTMLLLTAPLVVAASTQPDFLAMYPKLKMVTEKIGFDPAWWQKILFELSYGSDFLTIELFFRGFLVLAFIKWAGEDVILPMACFYCTIHFGKPMGECISSYFGGMLLGIVVCNTRSVWGGLLVHLGIAWMMELGGYAGNQLF